ncbi:MAG: hypothetical protein IT342_19610 [Candidatus Melainabacteria bacterium]|nr:hypothetical protein [Candidatus Melainabacteria bacterium]
MQRSDDGEMALYDSRDKFHASFMKGKWHDTLLFQDHQLDEFSVVEDEIEIESILAEARAALNQPLKDSADSRAKSA